MKVTLDDEEIRAAISLYLEEQELTVLDSSIKFTVDDYGLVEFTAEIE